MKETSYWPAVAIELTGREGQSADIQDLAAESLSLLQEAVYDSKFPGLFTLEVYGSIIGMFELNNIGKAYFLCNIKFLGLAKCAFRRITNCVDALNAEIRFSLSLTNWPMGMSGILAPSPIEEYLMYIHMDHGDDIDPADRKAAREITGRGFENVSRPLYYISF